MNQKGQKQLESLDWLENYGDYLYAFAKSRVYGTDIAEDLVQETLLAAWKGRNNFQAKSSVKTWLTSILRRKIIDFYRSNAKNKEVSWEDFSSPYEDKGAMKGHWLESRGPQDWNLQPSAPMESKEFMLALENCLADLPIKWKSAITLKIFEEFTTDELCKELDVSASNLWVLIHRAKVKLRECLEINWFMEGEKNG